MFSFHLKKLRRYAFSRLPQNLRHSIIRNLLTIPQQIDPQQSYKLAETEGELQSAYRLLHDCYVALNYIQPHKNRLRLLPHFVLPTSATLVAKHGEEVVGTLSIIKNSVLRLPMEKTFSLAAIEKRTSNYAEISALAVKPEYRRAHGGDVFLFMLKFMYHYSVSHLNIDHLCIVIHPKEEDFYSGLLFFKRIPGTDVVSYMGAPALAMYLDLNEALIKFEEIYGMEPANKNLLSFFMSPTQALEYIRRPYHLRSFQVVTPEIFETVFLKAGSFFESLTYLDFIHLKRELRHTSLYQYFIDASVAGTEVRSEVRYHVQMHGMVSVENALLPVDVFEVSGRGFVFSSSHKLNLQIGSEFSIRLEIGHDKEAQLRGKVMWTANSRFGIQITEFDAEWASFTNYLYHTRSGSYLLRLAR